MVYGQTKWGWGRIKPELDEVIASQKFPWKLIYALIIVLPIYLVYYFLGLEFGKFSFLLHIIVTVVLALPIFGLVIVACSHLHGSKTAPFDASKIKYQDASFESTWKGKKVPIETLYEAFFAEKISFEGDLLEALRDRYHFAHFGFTLGHLKYFFGQLIPELLVHSKAQDTDQVQDHYDRGNDFYRAFLGPLMVYTSGIFENPEDTLEVAQMNKIEGIFDKIHLKKGDRLLDLGCGWGTFVVEAAKRGANPTGVTLAKEQTKWANDLIKEAGIKANILNMDYRDVPREQGVYDKITCLEMAEHVGVKLFPSFLQQVKYMLKDDGIFYLQIAGLRRPWQYEDLVRSLSLSLSLSLSFCSYLSALLPVVPT
eukprot:TRINITY_DN3931_c0_g1_i12.p1 TRINITY_DN3931_c0_g1~~TRINITY_DN3931_c0_g1_i12.p1  ORF type:complete len:369 (+),score=124.33 TRINITY_DN3931_c0_g1_i12:282-1388(+)